jgi:hypothetical protein
MSAQSPGVPSVWTEHVDHRPNPHPVAGLSGVIHRPFFTAAIVTILTVGASWGVLILWRIGFSESFTGVSALEINAHGHAQISGWVGLFMMGFAYRAFPRVWHTHLVAPRVAVAVFVTMLAGLTTATLGMGISSSAAGLPLAMAGGALELSAILVFAVQLVLTSRRGTATQPFTAFVVVALGWFVAQAAFGLWHTWTTMTNTGDDFLWYIATYQAPLRDLQVHGMAMTMILGVSTFVLPAVFDVPQVPARRARRALIILTLAVAGESVVFVLYRFADDHRVAALLMVPWLMLAVAVAMIALPWRLWRPLPRDDGRSGKFVRAAYAWLAVSLTMLILMPVYQAASGLAFSHAYYGAIRHAITVGFVSLMIIGISSRAVAAFHGVPMRTLTNLWGPFILINLGCFLRVTLQTLTDWNPAFYDVVGISGLLELTGIAWWGIGLIALMSRGRRRSHEAQTRALQSA